MATTIQVDDLDEHGNVTNTTMMPVEESETTMKQILNAVETSKCIYMLFSLRFYAFHDACRKVT